MIHFSGSKSLPCGPIKKEALQVSHLINCLTRYVGYHFQSRNVGLHLAGICCLLVSWSFLLTIHLPFLSHALELLENDVGERIYVICHISPFVHKGNSFY